MYQGILIREENKRWKYVSWNSNFYQNNNNQPREINIIRVNDDTRNYIANGKKSIPYIIHWEGFLLLSNNTNRKIIGDESVMGHQFDFALKNNNNEKPETKELDMTKMTHASFKIDR